MHPVGHILIAEDDRAARLSMVAVLEDAGYSVTAAADGETAIALLQQTTSGVACDVVITDIRMGNIDGIAVLHAAKKLVRPPEVIVLTGYGTIDTSIAALRAGAYDYLIKPCKPDDLLAYVARAIDRRQTQLRRDDALRMIGQAIGQLGDGPGPPPAPMPVPVPPSDPPAPTAPVSPPPGAADPRVASPPEPDEQPGRYLRVGGLRIDTFRHTVVFDGRPVHLTPIEYELLNCLARAQGRVLDYCEIAQHTHGNVTDRSEAHGLLKTHVQNLRRKIGPDYVISVRGTGYMLVDPERTETEH